MNINRRNKLNIRYFPNEEGIALKVEARELLEKIVAEWQNNPIIVQHFDSRLVERAEFVVKRLNEITI
jgi:hypothetical protein